MVDSIFISDHFQPPAADHLVQVCCSHTVTTIDGRVFQDTSFRVPTPISPISFYTDL